MPLSLVVCAATLGVARLRRGFGDDMACVARCGVEAAWRAGGVVALGATVIVDPEER